MLITFCKISAQTILEIMKILLQEFQNYKAFQKCPVEFFFSLWIFFHPDKKKQNNFEFFSQKDDFLKNE
jgi:hypothetical protein